MFDIGFSELLIVAVVALIVLGPEKLPTAVRTVGLWVGKIRRSVASIQSEISEELRLDELRRQAAIEKDELERELNEMRQPYRNTTEQDRSSAFESVTDEDSSSKSESEKKGQDV
ncbi:Sec-independent protein translocase protein TatB [Neptuniibacter sp. CAU 1671]|uniref:Sec-independent protein translocase protein TatB n=1 Tax=Neptuniibacter sp. CAU 1671 TaxID=3032593 RepID=UPI0023DAF1D1|nr:Sec-independent protein translocase protein TatB [Neptuniibacter sp. CAU 1671]MDF2182967.1 Sec-independent protein translocase protein TatB [Neptuniibacter sp. CAU 1671]